MPYKSAAQARYFNAHRAQLEKQGVSVGEWNKSTDFSHLPETHVANWMESESEHEKSAGTKGAFSGAAAKAGQSTASYAEEKKDAPGKAGKRARMALMFMKAKH